MAAPTYIGAGPGDASASSGQLLDLTLATGWQQDDINVILVAFRGIILPVVPSGYNEWTDLATNNPSGSTGGWSVRVYWRRLQTGDADPGVAMESATTNQRYGRTFLIRPPADADHTGDPRDVGSSLANAASATVSTTAITTTVAETLALFLYAYEDDPTGNSGATGYTAEAVYTSSTGADAAIGGFHKQLATTSTENPSTTVSGGTFTNSISVGTLIALKGSVAGGAVSGTFTAAAVIRKTIDQSFTSNAILRKTTSGSFTSDAIFRAATAGSFVSDSVLKSVVSNGFTADSVLKSTISGTTFARAILRKTVSQLFFRADAVIKTVNPRSFTADAVLRSIVTESFTADSVLIHPSETVSGSFTADAVLQKSQEFVALADSILLAEASASVTADAVIIKTSNVSFTADSILSVIGTPVWTTPIDQASVATLTPTLAFNMPSQTSGDMFFQIELDTVNTFDSPDYRVYNSDEPGWEVWDGGAWVTMPVPVPADQVGVEARFTVPTELTAGTWFRRVRGGV